MIDYSPIPQIDKMKGAMRTAPKPFAIATIKSSGQLPSITPKNCHFLPVEKNFWSNKFKKRKKSIDK